MDNPTLAACILINQRERNKAIGIQNDTQFVRGLVQYINKSNGDQLKGAIEWMSEVAYITAMIEEHQAMAKRLTDYIMENIEDDDTRNEGVYVMTKLESYVTYLGERLEQLWQH